MARIGLQIRQRHPKAETIRDLRLWIACFGVAAIVTFALVSGVIVAVHANSPHGFSGQSAMAAQAPAESGAPAGQEDPRAEEQAGSPAGPESPAASASPDWRDADFAVDPSRVTWNRSPSGKKTVYLTIDDGPSENTQAVLDILDRYGCKATFFVVGHNEDCFPMIAEAYRRGHTIGLHTYSHDYAAVYASPEAYFADLDAIGRIVADQIGYVPCFIRFPGGSSNEISADYCEGIMSALVAEVQARGYQYYDWNLSVGDGAEHTSEEIVGYGTEPLEDDDNIVLLCHDSAAKQATVEALPAIIEHYQSLGYAFEALDRTTWACHHGVSN